MRKQRIINYDLKKYNDHEMRFIKILLEESNAMFARHGEPLISAVKLSRTLIIEVCRKLGATTIYINKHHYSKIKTRNLIIKERLDQGEKLKKLSAEYGLSLRQIYCIKNKHIDNLPPQETNELNQTFALVAAHMMIKIGIDQNDAISAARGLIAVVTARVGGIDLYIPSEKPVMGILNQLDINRHYLAGKSIRQLSTHYKMTPDEIETIIKNNPVMILPDSSVLPTIRTQLFNLASNLSGYAEINTLLGSAAAKINRAEEIIKNLERGKNQTVI